MKLTNIQKIAKTPFAKWYAKSNGVSGREAAYFLLFCSESVYFDRYRAFKQSAK